MKHIALITGATSGIGEACANVANAIVMYNNSSGMLTSINSQYGLYTNAMSSNSGGTLSVYGRCASSYFTDLAGTYKIRVLGIKL